MINKTTWFIGMDNCPDGAFINGTKLLKEFVESHEEINVVSISHTVSRDEETRSPTYRYIATFIMVYSV